jgi:hypothetical protein
VEGILPGTRMGRVRRSVDIRLECWAGLEADHSYRDTLDLLDKDTPHVQACPAYTAATLGPPVPVDFALGPRARPDLRRFP